MSFAKTKINIALVSLIAGLSIAFGLLMFSAGCAGDSKTGVYGDPIEALRIESIAMNVLLAQIVLIGVSYWVISSKRFAIRFVSGQVWAVVSFFVLFPIGMFIQGVGVSACQP